MIPVRIVCTHDALKVAETLMRLLEAEEHQVRLAHGRQSLSDLEAAKAARDAVLLIWSANAPSQHYMREWARNIAPARLVEIARAPGWPAIERKAPVIDFINWRGERGARVWNALNERLRTIARALEPPKPPPSRAALALGLAGIAAVSGAVIVRVHETAAPIAGAPEAVEPALAAIDAGSGVGGPLSAIEPESAEDLAGVRALPNPRFTPLALTQPPDLIEIPEYVPPTIRPPTLMERLSALNPLREEPRDDEN